MMNLFTRSRLFSFVWISIVLWVTSNASAATADSWTNNASGLWSTALNWSSNQAPNSIFSLILVTNANSKTVTVDAATPSANLSIQSLTLSAPPSATNTLALTDVTTNVPLQISGALTVDRGGLLILTNSAVASAGITVNRGGAINLTNSALKETSFAFFDVVNGSVWLDSGLIDCGANQAVRLGRTNNSTGNLILNGGSMISSDIQLGTLSASRGVLTVSGGNLNATNLLTLGYAVNATGVVSVTSGQLTATNNFTYVGKSGFGQMTIAGGSATFAFLSVGNNANGLLSVTGGQLTVKPRTTNDWTQIGNIGVGQFSMSGGTVLLFSELHVGDDSSGFGTGSGAALITGGQLIATNDTTAIGRYGPGVMTLTNATAWLTNVSVGRHDGSIGTLNIQSNAQLYLLDALSIARFSNSVGHVLVTGGLLSLTNDNIWVGREGTGDMIISNGTVQALSGFVALSTVVTDSITALVVTNMPSGTLTVAGGNLLLSSNLLVGTSTISTGQVLIAGGNLTIGGSGNTGYMAVSSGTFTLDHGSVTTGNVFLTNNTGGFNFKGGTLQAKNITVANGAPFVIGDGFSPATLVLQGGTYSFADGLVISNNATVTGCGTILGSISNFGTLATNCAPTGVTITATTKNSSTNTIFFTTINGSNHVLEYKNTLNDLSWTAILPGVVGNGQVMSRMDTNAIVPTRFYRIHLE